MNDIRPTPHFLRKAKTVAVNAALKAGRIITSYTGKNLSVNEKRLHDFVTQADKESEEAIIKTIRSAFPDHDILAEESGLHKQSSECRWIIDPLDGTTNFIHGLPLYCVSIALEINGVISVGVVYEPVRKELFSAVSGRGAFLNGKPIRVSECSEPSKALLATGFPYRDYSMIENYLQLFKYFMTHSAGIRRPGSAALDLCYLACGRVDGFWELFLNPWDVAAGAVIIAEAGGALSDFNGGNNYIYGGNIIGSNKSMHPWMIAAARDHFSEHLNQLGNLGYGPDK